MVESLKGKTDMKYEIQAKKKNVPDSRALS